MDRMTDLVLELKACTDKLKEAEQEEQAARSETINARNALSRVQQEFDKAVEEIKKNSPDAYWGSRPRGEPVDG